MAHWSGKRWHLTCALPGVGTDRRMQLEVGLRRRLPAGHLVSNGDLDWDNDARLHVFTDDPNTLVDRLGKYLAEHAIDLTQCRVAVRELERPVVLLPGVRSADDIELRNIASAFWEASHVFADVIRRHPGKPRSWRQLAITRLQHIKIAHRQAVLAVHAGFNIPPPDPVGLISVWDLVKINPKLFPHLCNPKFAVPTWQKPSGRPRS
jgi:hypothetical protein